MKLLLTVIAITASMSSVSYASKAKAINKLFKNMVKASDDGLSRVHEGDVQMAINSSHYTLRNGINKDVTSDIMTNTFNDGSKFTSSIRLKTNGTSPTGLYNLSEESTLLISQNKLTQEAARDVIAALLKNKAVKDKLTYKIRKSGDHYSLKVTVLLEESSTQYIDVKLVSKLVNDAHKAVLNNQGSIARMPMVRTLLNPPGSN